MATTPSNQPPERIKTATAAAALIARARAAVKLALDALKVEQAAAKARIKVLEGVLVKQTAQAWCADLTEDAAGEVATVEIPGEGKLVLIAPEGRAPTAADGALVAREAQTPAQVFFNAAILPGWQKFKPTYRRGIITALNAAADTADVTLTNDLSSAQGLGINVVGGLKDVPVQYMSCNAAAFEVGDACVIEFVGQAWGAPRVVGFVSNPRACNAGRLYLAFFTPKDVNNAQGVPIDYTDISFAGEWNREGTYTFVSTTPELKTFKAAGSIALANVETSTYTQTGPNSGEGSTYVLDNRALALGFFDGEFVYLDLSSESTGSRSDSEIESSEDGVSTFSSKVKTPNAILSSGAATRTHHQGSDGWRGSYVVTDFSQTAWLSGNLVRAKTLTQTMQYSDTDGEGSKEKSPGVVQSSLFLVAGVPKKGRAMLDASVYGAVPTITTPGASGEYSVGGLTYTPDFYTVDAFSASYDRAPAQATLGLADNAGQRARIALWQGETTLLNPALVDAATGTVSMQPASLAPGTLMATSASASLVFSAIPVAGTGKKSNYIYSYAGAYVATVPPASFGAWDQKALYLYDRCMVHTNATNARPLSGISINVFWFEANVWQTTALQVSSEVDPANTPAGQIPRALVPAGAYFVRAFRDELDSLGRAA